MRASSTLLVLATALVAFDSNTFAAGGADAWVCVPATFATREVTRVDGAAQGAPRETRRECPRDGTVVLGCDRFAVRLADAKSAGPSYVFSSARSRGILEVVQDLVIDKASGRFEQRVTTETSTFTSIETTTGVCAAEAAR